ncbi:MAG TPA: hypothetical protein VNE61_00120 [Ktedonobacteraceae bacterium]|nr:hypothetical protein [Ktedonobacteraceae bacterium]
MGLNRPAIDLHIDELILRDVPYAQRQRIAAAIEQELTRLLTERGVPPSLARGGFVPRIKLDDIQTAAGAKPAAIGNHIAQNIYSNLAVGQSDASEPGTNEGK